MHSSPRILEESTSARSVRRFFGHIPDTREPEERNAIRAFGDQDSREAPETRNDLSVFFYPSNSDNVSCFLVFVLRGVKVRVK